MIVSYEDKVVIDKTVTIPGAITELNITPAIQTGVLSDHANYTLNWSDESASLYCISSGFFDENMINLGSLDSTSASLTYTYSNEMFDSSWVTASKNLFFAVSILEQYSLETYGFASYSELKVKGLPAFEKNYDSIRGRYILLITKNKRLCNTAEPF